MSKQVFWASSGFWLSLLICASFTMKVFLFFHYKAYSSPTMWEFQTIAQNLLAGKGYLMSPRFGVEYKAYIAPFYPILSYLIYSVFGVKPGIIMLLQIGASCVLIYCVYVLSKELFHNFYCAFIAAGLVAFHPALIVYSVFQCHELIFIALFYTIVLYLSLCVSRKPSLKLMMIYAVFSVLAIYTKATLVPFLVIFSLLFIFRHSNFISGVKYIFTYWIIVIALYSPWVIRNYFVLDQFVLFQSYKGECLWFGNNEYTNGSLHLENGQSVIDYTSKSDLLYKLLNSKTEIDHMKLFEEAVRNFWKTYPQKAIFLTLNKFYSFWWFTSSAGMSYPSLWKKIYKVYYLPLLIFFIVGLSILFFNDKRKFTILLIFFLSYSLMHAVYYIEMRHRWCVEAIIISIATSGFLWLLKKFKKPYALKNIPKFFEQPLEDHI